MKVIDNNLINTNLIKNILKKNNLTKYYEHVPIIIYNLTGNKLPEISKENEEKIRNMFKIIQEPYFLYKPKHRKSLVRYHYIFYKCCE